MGIAERREREKELRRNNILDAAEHLFFTRGLNTATMDDVAEQAELSKGTLYLYFKNKHDLYHAINYRGMQLLIKLFAEAQSKYEYGIEKIRAIGEAYLRFARDHSDYYNAMMYFEACDIDLSDNQSYSTRCHHCSMQVMDVVAAAVKAGIDDGSIRPELDPLETAYVLWGQSTGVIQIISNYQDHWRKDPDHKINPDDLIPAMFEMTMHALINKNWKRSD